MKCTRRLKQLLEVANSCNLQLVDAAKFAEIEATQVTTFNQLKKPPMVAVIADTGTYIIALLTED